MLRKFYKYITLSVLIGVAFLSVKGQEIYPDCVNPKIVSLPLKKDSIQEKIYYQQNDKYTYWYKIEVENTAELSYKLTSISNDDDYEILIYNFKGDNFCNDIVNRKIDPTINGSAGSIKIKQGETYYFGVLHISGFGCGHTLKIINNKKQIILKTIQHECVEEAIAEIVTEKDIVVKQLQETVKIEETVIVSEITKLDSIIRGKVTNSNTQQHIEATITIIKGAINYKVKSSIDSGFVLNNNIDDRIILKIVKFGYETLLDTIVLNSRDITIELNPIKVGDKLIMRKIYFHPNTYVLKETSKKELKKLLVFMLENENYSFEIQGHTNGNRNIKVIKRYANLGEGWNFKGSSKKLSKLRAGKIKAYLIKNGVQENKLATVGYGGDRMVVKKPKNMNQAMKNIRVEVIVVQ